MLKGAWGQVWMAQVHFLPPLAYLWQPPPCTKAKDCKAASLLGPPSSLLSPGPWRDQAEPSGTMVGLKPSEVPPTTAVKFLGAGTAACFADLLTFPLDTAKVRLQVSTFWQGHCSDQRQD